MPPLGRLITQTDSRRTRYDHDGPPESIADGITVAAATGPRPLAVPAPEVVLCEPQPCTPAAISAGVACACLHHHPECTLSGVIIER